MLLRAIWFIFIGWWLSGLAITVAYLFCVTIIGLPVGFWIFNRLPLILTLRERSGTTTTEVRDGITYVVNRNVEQYPMWARAIGSCSSGGGLARSTSRSPGPCAS